MFKENNVDISAEQANITTALAFDFDNLDYSPWEDEVI